MTMWVPDLSGRMGPAYLAIADAINAAVVRGELVTGARLPPQRELAYRLGLSLHTVTRAYAEATRRGLLEGTVGRGTYVRHSGPAKGNEQWSPAAAMNRPSPESAVIDFANNLPNAGEAGQALARTLGDLSNSTDLRAFLDHRPNSITERHTEAALRSLDSLGLDRQGRCVVLTNGAQQGVFVSLMALTRPGDAILIEELTYAPVLSIARHLGLTIFPVAMDSQGIDPEALDSLCQSTAARVLYCMPTLHTPTTATMSPARREAIGAIAHRYRLHIVEDDVFGFLPSARPAPLATYAPDLTVFVTSTSKSLAPGLRVGYVHAPARLQGALHSAVAMTSWMPSPLMAEIATRWIENGIAVVLNDQQRVEAEHRQSLARLALAGHDIQADPSGFHVWLPLPGNWHPDSFAAAAERNGVALRSGTVFAACPGVIPKAVRLCLSHELRRDRVQLGLQRVAQLLNECPDDGAFIV